MKFAQLAELQSLIEAKSPVIDDKRYYVFAKKKKSGKLVIVMDKSGYEKSEYAEEAYDEYKETIAGEDIEDFSWSYEKGSKLKKLMGLNEGLMTEVQVRLKPATRVKALDHFGSESENPQGHKDIKNSMKFLDIDSLAKEKLHSIDSDGNVADFKKHARNLGFKELEYPDNNDAKLAGFERVGIKNGTSFWKKGNALLLLNKDTPPTFMIKESVHLDEGAGNLSRSIENWMDATKTYHFEGEGGVRNFTKLVQVLGYGSLDKFFADNSGAIEAVINWIGAANVPEWQENFAEFGESEDDEDDEG